MNGYEIYCHYVALKLHFTSKSYDYFKYNGKVGHVTPDSFERRKDKYYFHKLARKLNDDEVLPFLLANFLKNQKVWTQDLLEPTAYETYQNWRKKYEALSYVFDQDMGKIKTEFDSRNLGIASMFNCCSDKMPIIWTMMNQNEIEFETVAILHGLTGVLDKWDEQYKSDYLYEKTSMLLRKYIPFLGLDVPKFKKIAIKHLTAA